MIILPLAFLTMAATPTRTTGAGVVAMMSDGDGDSVTKLLASLPVLDLLALLFLQEIRFCVILSSKTRQKQTRRRGGTNERPKVYEPINPKVERHTKVDRPEG